MTPATLAPHARAGVTAGLTVTALVSERIDQLPAAISWAGEIKSKGKAIMDSACIAAVSEYLNKKRTLSSAFLLPTTDYGGTANSATSRQAASGPFWVRLLREN
jgi:hypothetical protein